MKWQGGHIQVPDGINIGRAIELGETVMLADGRCGIVKDRCEGAYVFFYIVLIDGQRERVETDKLTPVEMNS